MKNWMYIIATLITFTSCEKIIEVYVGMPLQPKNINAEFEYALNAFGVLKSGPTLDTLNNYFEAQLIVDMNDTAFILSDVNFEISHLEGTSAFTYYADSIGPGEFSSPSLNPMPGEVYTIYCTTNDGSAYHAFDTTIIPNTPEIVNGSISRIGETLNFSLQQDNSAFMYDIYALSASNGNFKRVVANKNNATQISIDVKTTEPLLLYVFACDKNFEEYISTSNIFFKPNAFRPRFSTLYEGYGCFYSVCSQVFEIP